MIGDTKEVSKMAYQCNKPIIKLIQNHRESAMKYATRGFSKTQKGLCYLLALNVKDKSKSIKRSDVLDCYDDPMNSI